MLPPHRVRPCSGAVSTVDARVDDVEQLVRPAPVLLVEPAENELAAQLAHDDDDHAALRLSFLRGLTFSIALLYAMP